MRTRRGGSGLSGILLVDKPSGMTSHDVVMCVRRAARERRVGHAGTLDPMATGLLVVLVGPYTRLAQFLASADKSYLATITFGYETDTDDACGAPTRSAAPPERVHDIEFARSTLKRLLGDSLQTPPLYSAIKVGGATAHRVARAGGEMSLAPRPITVTRAELIRVHATVPAWEVEFTVSKGTYVRALARDIGRSVGSAAHLSALRRVASGTLMIDDAHPLNEIGATPDVSALFTDPLDALDLPVIDADSKKVRHGREIALPSMRVADAGSHVAVVCEGRLSAIYTVGEDTLIPVAVFPSIEPPAEVC